MIQAFNPFVKNDYPTSDGRPMAETDWHRTLMLQLIETLKFFYADEKNTYVSGNLLIFYQMNNKRKHVSPDTFVVKGIPKGDRPNFLLWEERKGPDVVIELTSKTTKKEDITTKMALYRDVLRAKEYILFDPLEDYLEPSLQGFRLVAGDYQPIKLMDGRLPSKVLGLHCERSGFEMRLWNPATELWIPTPEERAESAEERAETAEERAETAEERAETAEERAETAEQRADTAEERAKAAEAETARLRQLLQERENGKHKNGK
jgi:Uma2 family endonuclease